MRKPVCAIHQPNFFPWLGYFDKIKKADSFVFLDDVQFSKQSWTTRVSIDDHGEAKWLSCPVTVSLGQKISEVRVRDFQELGLYVTGRFKSVYRHAPYFTEILAFIEECFGKEQNRLGAFNEQVIRSIALKLGLNTPFVLQSGLGIDESLKANDLLVAICKKVGAHTYMCGGGAGDYQDNRVFADAGLEVAYQSYSEPKYRETDLRGLSILDVLAHLGWERTTQLVNGF